MNDFKCSEIQIQARQALHTKLRWHEATETIHNIAVSDLVCGRHVAVQRHMDSSKEAHLFLYGIDLTPTSGGLSPCTACQSLVPFKEGQIAVQVSGIETCHKIGQDSFTSSYISEDGRNLVRDYESRNSRLVCSYARPG